MSDEYIIEAVISVPVRLRVKGIRGDKSLIEQLREKAQLRADSVLVISPERILEDERVELVEDVKVTSWNIL